MWLLYRSVFLNTACSALLCRQLGPFWSLKFEFVSSNRHYDPIVLIDITSIGLHATCCAPSQTSLGEEGNLYLQPSATNLAVHRHALIDVWSSNHQRTLNKHASQTNITPSQIFFSATNLEDTVGTIVMYVLENVDSDEYSNCNMLPTFSSDGLRRGNKTV